MSIQAYSTEQETYTPGFHMAENKETFDRLGIQQAEQKYLAGVTAQYESEAVYHKVREDLEKLGMIFTDMDTALRLYPDIIKEEQTFQQERRLTVVPLLTLI